MNYCSENRDQGNEQDSDNGQDSGEGQNSKQWTGIRTRSKSDAPKTGDMQKQQDFHSNYFDFDSRIWNYKTPSLYVIKREFLLKIQNKGEGENGEKFI